MSLASWAHWSSTKGVRRWWRRRAEERAQVPVRPQLILAGPNTKRHEGRDAPHAAWSGDPELGGDVEAAVHLHKNPKRRVVVPREADRCNLGDVADHGEAANDVVLEPVFSGEPEDGDVGEQRRSVENPVRGFFRALEREDRAVVVDRAKPPSQLALNLRPEPQQHGAVGRGKKLDLGELEGGRQRRADEGRDVGADLRWSDDGVGEAGVDGVPTLREADLQALWPVIPVVSVVGQVGRGALRVQRVDRVRGEVPAVHLLARQLLVEVVAGSMSSRVGSSVGCCLPERLGRRDRRGGGPS